MFQAQWGEINPVFAEYSARGTMHLVTHPKFTVLTNAYPEALKYFSQIYPSQYVTSYLAALSLGDPGQRAATVAALQSIVSGGVVAPDPTGVYGTEVGGGGQVGQVGSGPYGFTPQTVDAQVFTDVMGDPSKFAKLSRLQQQDFIAKAQSVLAYDKAHQGSGESLQRTLAVIATGNLDVALNPDEIDKLRGFVESYRAPPPDPGLYSGQPRGPTLAAHVVGAEPSAEGPTFAIDPEWAKLHPAKAAATAWYLQQRFPDAEVRYGAPGIAESVFELISKPVDVVGAFPTAGLRWLSEAVRGKLEDPEDLEAVAAARDELRAKLESGEIPQAQHEDVLKTLDEMNDQLGIDQPNFMDMVELGLNPRHINDGYAQNLVAAAGLNPGDTGYDAARGVAMLVGAFVFDPLTWGPGVARGVAAARNLAKGSRVVVDGIDAANVVRGWLANRVYRVLGKTPEAWLDTPLVKNAVGRLWEAKQTLSPADFDVFLQDFLANPAHRVWLWGARDRADFDAVIAMSMTGSVPESVSLFGVFDRIAGLAKQLNETDQLRAAAAAATSARPLSRSQLLRLDELLAAERDFKMELAWLNDVKKGNLFEGAPLEIRDIRAINDALKEGRLGRLQHTISSGFQNFPANVVRGVRGTRRDDQAKEIMTAFRNLWEPTGLEGAEAVGGRLKNHIFLPGSDVPSGALAGAVERSREALMQFARANRIPEAVRKRIMGRWDELVVAGDEGQSYRWLTEEAWPGIIENSAVLDAAGKQQMMRLWQTHFEARGSDRIVTSAAGEYVVTEPLMYRESVSNGQRFKSGMPVFEQDLVNGVPLPGAQDWLDYASATRRLVHGWQEARGAKGLAAGVTSTGAHAFSTFTTIWKKYILGFSAPGRLPARVVGELLFGRMAAYDLATIVNDPLTWWRSVRGTRQFADFAESPGFALGGIIQDFEDAGRNALFASQRGIVSPQDGTLFWNAYSGRGAALNKSASVHYMLKYDSADAFLAWAKSPEAPYAIKRMVAHWGTGDLTADQVAKRAWAYVHDSYGGTGTAADEVRESLRIGELGGYDVGSAEYAQELRRLNEAGEWQPGIVELHGQHGFYVGPSAGDKRSFYDGLMEFFYSKPERTLARDPAFRQLAVRYRDRLLGFGYPRERAVALAFERAARDTSRMMFKIGAHTSGEMNMRVLSPFFPAWRETTATWMLRLPERLGGGPYPGARWLGGLFMLRRGNLLWNAGKDLGIIRQDPSGRWVVPVPFLAPLFNAILPEDVSVSAPVDSLFGVLPFPRVEGLDEGWENAIGPMLPGLGVPGGVVISSLANHVKAGWMQDIADVFLPFGRAVGFGPMQASRIWMGMALWAGWHGTQVIPPWERLASPDWQVAVANWAIQDSLRALMASGRPEYAEPLPSAYDLAAEGAKGAAAKAAYIKDFQEWRDNLVRDAEKITGQMFLWRGISGMILPFAISADTKAEQEITAIWSLLNASGVPEELRSEVAGGFLDSFKAAHPGADWYTVGKNEVLAAHGVLTGAAVDDVQSLWRQGLLHVRTPEEYATWAYGMGAYSVYQAQRSAIFDTFENNPVKYLLSGAERNATLGELDGEWDAFLTLQHQLWLADTVGMNAEERKAARDTDFSHVYELWKAERDAKANNGELPILTSLGQDQLLKAKVALSSVQDHIEAGTYKLVRGEIFDALGRLDYGPAESSMFRAIDKWYRTVADPYYQKVNAIYERIATTPSAERGSLYDRLRQLANSQKPVTIGGNRMPSPEMVAFYNKTPEQQERWAIGKLALNPWWLTSFQQKQLGYLGTPKVAKFTDQINEAETLLAQRMIGVSHSSTEYIRAREAFDAYEADLAKKAGLSKMWKEWDEPLYWKIDQSLGFDNPSWQHAIIYANQAVASITAADLVWNTTSPRALPVQHWLMDRLMTMYRNDPSFASIIDNIGAGLSPDKPIAPEDTIAKAFLGTFGGAPAALVA